MFAANFLYAVCSPFICNKQRCGKMFIDKLQHSWHQDTFSLIPLSTNFDCEPLSNIPPPSLNLRRAEPHITKKALCLARINHNTTYCILVTRLGTVDTASSFRRAENMKSLSHKLNQSNFILQLPQHKQS